MSAEDLTELESAFAAAEAEVAARRADHLKQSEVYRELPGPRSKADVRQASAALSQARERLEMARVALALFRKQGGARGLLVEQDRVTGTIAVRIPAGTSQEARMKLIDAELEGRLLDAGQELGAILGASPDRYCRERPGRDAEGRVVLEVFGRAEADVLLPALPGAGRLRR